MAPPTPLRKHVAAFGAVALAGILAYLPALNGEFQFDDAMGVERGSWYLPKDPAQKADALWKSLRSWSSRGWVTLSYQLNFWMAGGNEMKFLDLNAITFPFHAFNLKVHLLTVLGLYLLLGWMGRSSGRPGWLAPALGAGLFALHPLATESVAYISSRTGTVATCGAVWGVLGLLAFAGPRPDGAPPSPLARAAGLMLLGMGTVLAVGFKESGWMIPPLGAAALFWSYRGDARRFWRDWGLAVLGGGLVFLLAGLWWVEERDMLGDAFFWQYSALYGLAPTRALPSHAATELHAWWSFLGPRVLLPLGPWHMTVDPDPPMLRMLPETLAASPELRNEVALRGAVWLLPAAELLGLLAGAWLAWRSWRRGSWAGLGLVWILLGALPPALPALLDITAERHTYLPFLGVSVLLAFPLAGALLSRPRLGAAAAGMLLCLAVLARDRAADWGTEAALWRSAVRDTPRKARPYYNLAKSLARRCRDLPEAERARAERLALRSNALLRQSLKISPGFHLSHGALARGLDFLGRKEDAVGEFREAVRCHMEALGTGEAPPLHAGQIAAHTDALARTLLGLGRQEEAVSAYRQAIEWHVAALQAAGSPELQRFHAEQAAGLYQRMGRWLVSAGLRAVARQVLQEGLKRFPNCPPLRKDLERLEGPA